MKSTMAVVVVVGGALGINGCSKEHSEAPPPQAEAPAGEANTEAPPSAAKNYHVFECPMAKGYKRWAQADAKMANPYMGTAMLEFGTEVHEQHMKDGNHGDHGH